jgi:glutamate 5-kinase
VIKVNRIVIKVGSAVLSENGDLAYQRLQNLVKFICELSQKKEVILVSSGAVAAGFTLLQLDKTIVQNKQALASLGQSYLMHEYQKEFSKYNMLCSQVLLEKSIFSDNERLNHMQDAINVLLKNNVIPIINENDVTAVDELVFGDNDQLSSYVTHYTDSDMLVILSDIDGYYDDNPKTNKNANLLKTVTFITPDALDVSATPNNEFATGGIVTKLKAANFLLKNNKRMFLSSGFDLSNVYAYLIQNEHKCGTLFVNSKD